MANNKIETTKTRIVPLKLKEIKKIKEKIEGGKLVCDIFKIIVEKFKYTIWDKCNKIENINKIKITANGDLVRENGVDQSETGKLQTRLKKENEANYNQEQTGSLTVIYKNGKTKTVEIPHAIKKEKAQ